MVLFFKVNIDLNFIGFFFSLDHQFWLQAPLSYLPIKNQFSLKSLAQII